MAGNPILFSEYRSFFELTGIEPDAWELSALERLDAVAMESQSDA